MRIRILNGDECMKYTCRVTAPFAERVEHLLAKEWEGEPENRAKHLRRQNRSAFFGGKLTI